MVKKMGRPAIGSQIGNRVYLRFDDDLYRDMKILYARDRFRAKKEYRLSFNTWVSNILYKSVQERGDELQALKDLMEEMKKKVKEEEVKVE